MGLQWLKRMNRTGVMSAVNTMMSAVNTMINPALTWMPSQHALHSL